MTQYHIMRVYNTRCDNWVTISVPCGTKQNTNKINIKIIYFDYGSNMCGTKWKLNCLLHISVLVTTNRLYTSHKRLQCPELYGSLDCVSTCIPIWRHSAFYACILSELNYKNVKKGKSIPVTGYRVPQGCETSRLPHFLDNWLTDNSEVISLMRQPPFTPRNIPGTYFCYKLSQPQAHSMAERIRATKKSNDLIRNQTHNLPVYSTVPQQTMLLCALITYNLP
jgi:hypothetical protein